MGYRKAILAFNVPKTTLEKRLALTKEFSTDVEDNFGSFSIVFSIEREQELVILSA